MSKKSALGKGMDGLLPVGFDVGAVAEPGEKITQVKLDAIAPNKDQPRKTFDKEALEELASSIAEHGVIQPLIITTKNDAGEHEIIAGERRWRASKQAGLKTVPAIIRDAQAQQKLEIAIIENVQRVDLSPLEEAMSMYRLKQEFSLSLQDIAKKLGKASTTVSNTMRLLQLPEEAKNALMNKKITEGHARAILSLTDEKMQNKLLSTIITQSLSVRQAEVMAKQLKAEPTSKMPTKTRQQLQLSTKTSSLLKSVQSRIEGKLSFNAKSSQLIISVEDEDSLTAILKKLNNN